MTKHISGIKSPELAVREQQEMMSSGDPKVSIATIDTIYVLTSLGVMLGNKTRLTYHHKHKLVEFE